MSEKDGLGEATARAAGAEIVREEDKYTRMTSRGQVAPGDDFKYGADYFPVTPEKRAEIMREKEKLMRQLGDGWNASITDKDAMVAIKQNERMEKKRFDDWFSEFLPNSLDDPASQRVAQELNEDFFQRRIEKINQWSEIQKKIAIIQLMGPKNKEDLYILYLWQTGRLDVPDEPVFRQNARSDGSAEFSRGLFNWRRRNNRKNFNFEKADNSVWANKYDASNDSYINEANNPIPGLVNLKL